MTVQAFVLIRRWTAQRRARINGSYSLSERFQLAENVRVCRIVRNGILCAGAATAMLAVSLGLPVVFRALLLFNISRLFEIANYFTIYL